MNRVLVIGLDAATLDVMEPYVAAGYLPHIADLLRRGAYAPMRSTIPAMSPPAWTSIITGQNPGKHGIYDFLRFHPNTYRIEVTRSDQTRYRTIFDLASAYGRRVIAVNVPLTFPPRPVNGVMVSGLIIPERAIFTHPPELDAELRAHNYRREPGLAYTPGNDRDFFAEIEAVTRSQTDTMLRLMQREPWDLAMLVLRSLDEAMGFFWHHSDEQHPRYDAGAAQEFGDLILEAHRFTDNAIGELVAAAGPDTTIMLVSDHGAGPYHKEVFLNLWLERHGWLVRRTVHPLDRMRQAAERRIGLTRENLNLDARIDPITLWAIRRMIPESLRNALVPAEFGTLAETVDWSRTRAYSLGYIGQISLNLKGREPQGIVEPGHEREMLLNDITTALFQLTDEGQSVVDEVYRREEIYHGPYETSGADLNLLMRGMTYITQSWRELAGETLFAPSPYSGTHRPTGMMAVCGNEILPIGRHAEVSLYDIAPLVLWSLDLPIPDDIDGRFLTPMISPMALRQRPPKNIEASAAPPPTIVSSGWSDPAEQQETLHRLRDLGYLE